MSAESSPTHHPYRVELRFSDFFSLVFFQEIVRWCFTWIIACIPIGFLWMKSHMIDDEASISLIASKGEIFVVCIVMLAEPLSSLVTGTRREEGYATSMAVLLGIIIFLVSSAYFLCIIEMSEPRIHHSLTQMRNCQSNYESEIPMTGTCDHACDICNEYDEISIIEHKYLKHKNSQHIDIQQFYDKALTQQLLHGINFVLLLDKSDGGKNDKNHLDNEEPFDNFVLKIRQYSVLWFKLSFVLSLYTFYHLHAMEVRARAKKVEKEKLEEMYRQQVELKNINS